jgi:hypothetical protein
MPQAASAHPNNGVRATGATGNSPPTPPAGGRAAAPTTAPPHAGPATQAAPATTGAPAKTPGPATPAAPAGPQYRIDAGGYLALAGGDHDGRRVGWAATNPAFICVSKDGVEGVPIADAVIGTVTPGGPLLAVREIEVTGAVAVARRAAKRAPGPVQIKPKGVRLAIRSDAGLAKFLEPVLSMGAGWRPFDYENMRPSLRAVLRPASSGQRVEAQITLAEHGFWALMDFQIKGEQRRRIGWISGKESDASSKSQELANEVAKLPTAALKARVDDYARLIVSVMAHEGGFGARGAGKKDPQASIGIFQW